MKSYIHRCDMSLLTDDVVTEMDLYNTQQAK